MLSVGSSHMSKSIGIYLGIILIFWITDARGILLVG
jgi:hypothetical protein